MSHSRYVVGWGVTLEEFSRDTGRQRHYQSSHCACIRCLALYDARDVTPGIMVAMTAWIFFKTERT